jgi:phosphate uptake regulator
MELRKLQLTGGSSYTVTLPKEWVEQAELEAGDVVGFASQPDGSLAVYPHARQQGPAAKYDIEVATDDTDATFRSIVAAYLNGFDVMNVRSRKPLSSRVRRAVRKAAKRIIGLQVVEEDVNAITLQDFMDPKEFHIDKALRRMQAICRTMQEDALRVFQEPLDEEDSTFEERDDEVDSLYWIINKQYHAILRDPSYAQRMGVNANVALNYLLVARLIERTADHAARLAENVQALHGSEIQDKLENKIEKHARRAIQLFADSLQSYHKLDVDAANQLILEATRFKTAQDAVIKEALSLGGEEILHVSLALDSIARTAAYAADVAETAINHRVATKS